MTNQERRRAKIAFFRAVASELWSHIGNGSAFLYNDDDGDAASEELADFRLVLLEGLVEQLRARADRYERGEHVKEGT